MDMVFVVTFALLLVRTNVHALDEPKVACSAFDYDIQTLRTVVKLEIQMAEFDKTLTTWKTTMQAMLDKHSVIDAERENRTKELIDTVTTLKQQTVQKTKEMEAKFEETANDIRQDLSEQMMTFRVSVNATIDGYLQKQGKLAADSSKQVAFTAHSPTGNTVGENSPVFRTVLMNLGGGYHRDSGQFQCPVTGLYLFSVTLWTSSARTGGSEVYCWVRKNSKNIAYVSSYEGKYDSASVSVFIHLSDGDIVALKCSRWTHIYTGHEVTSFTGALVRAD